MITKLLTNKFLIFLYLEHINNFGESISTLDKGGLLILDESFSIKYPAIVKSIPISAFDLTFKLAKELESLGFVKFDSLSIFLTIPGFYEANRKLNPIKYFMQNQWKWYIPLAISTSAVFTAIFRLIQCT